MHKSFIAGVRTSAIKHTIKLLYVLLYVLLQLCEPHKRRVVRRRNLATRLGHVLGFISIGVVVTKLMTFFQKCGAVTSGSSVRPQAVGLYQPAGWQLAGPL